MVSPPTNFLARLPSLRRPIAPPPNPDPTFSELLATLPRSTITPTQRVLAWRRAETATAGIHAWREEVLDAVVEANEGDTGDERTRLVYRGAEDGGEDAVQELRRVLDKSEVLRHSLQLPALALPAAPLSNLQRSPSDATTCSDFLALSSHSDHTVQPLVPEFPSPPPRQHHRVSQQKFIPPPRKSSLPTATHPFHATPSPPQAPPSPLPPVAAPAPGPIPAKAALLLGIVTAPTPTAPGSSNSSPYGQSTASTARPSFTFSRPSLSSLSRPSFCSGNSSASLFADAPDSPTTGKRSPLLPSMLMAKRGLGHSRRASLERAHGLQRHHPSSSLPDLSTSMFKERFSVAVPYNEEQMPNSTFLHPLPSPPEAGWKGLARKLSGNKGGRRRSRSVGESEGTGKSFLDCRDTVLLSASALRRRVEDGDEVEEITRRVVRWQE